MFPLFEGIDGRSLVGSILCLGSLSDQRFALPKNIIQYASNKSILVHLKLKLICINNTEKLQQKIEKMQEK